MTSELVPKSMYDELRNDDKILTRVYPINGTAHTQGNGAAK